MRNYRYEPKFYEAILENGPADMEKINDDEWLVTLTDVRGEEFEILCCDERHAIDLIEAYAQAISLGYEEVT